MRKLLLISSIMLVGVPSTVLGGFISMLPSEIDAYLPMIKSVMEGKEIHVDQSLLPSQAFLASAYNPSNGEVYSAYTYNAGKKTWEYKGFSAAPKGSIAVVPVQGVLTRNDYCGWFGTMSLARVMDDARTSANIEGVLQDVGSPGGETYGSQSFSDATGACASVKPVVAHINEGYAASAAYWAICKSSKILLAREADQIGSIGTYARIVVPVAGGPQKDYKVVEVYSSTSPKKNADQREILESEGAKTALFQKKLDFVDALFMADVKAGRGDKLNAEALEGDMYFAADAIKMGLCDGMATREEALQEVLNLSGSSQSFS